MRKTNLNLKRVKFFKKIALFFVIQIIIFAFFASLMYGKSLTKTKLQTPYETTIKLDDVKYSRAGDTSCYVFSNSQKYIFTAVYTVWDDEYSNYELYKTLKPGDILNIQYIEDGKRKEIISAELNENILRSYDAYFEYVEREERYTIITFFVVECVFLLILSIYLFFAIPENKFFRKRNK